MNVTDFNEEFRRACCEGNLELFDKMLNNGAQINSQNKINGMTALHWACIRGHDQIITKLLKLGADPQIPRNDGKLPGDFLKCPKRDLFPTSCDVIEEKSNDFVPNYLKHPDFVYLDSDSRTNDQIDEPKSKIYDLITVKVKVKGESDFCETDISKLMSYDEFSRHIKSELSLKSKISLIRKLPNVLIRKDGDVKRLTEGVEIEVELDE